MKNLTIVLALMIGGFLMGQSNPCKKKLGEGYFPLDYNFEKRQSINNKGAYFIEEVMDTLRYQSITYTKFIAESEYTGKDLLLRRDKDTIWNFNRTEMLEHVYFIDKAEQGVKWNSANVVGVKEKVSTPYCEHEDLMKVREESRSGKVVDKYYQEGLGLVAKKVDDVLVQYYIPESSEMKSSSPKYGTCEDNRCTLQGVMTFVKTQMKIDDYQQSKDGRGQVLYQVNISDKGEVLDVEVLESMSMNKGSQEKVREYLSKLPNFVPAKRHAFKNRASRIKLQMKL